MSKRYKIVRRRPEEHDGAGNHPDESPGFSRLGALALAGAAAFALTRLTAAREPPGRFRNLVLTGMLFRGARLLRRSYFPARWLGFGLWSLEVVALTSRPDLYLRARQFLRDPGGELIAAGEAIRQPPRRVLRRRAEAGVLKPLVVFGLGVAATWLAGKALRRMAGPGPMTQATVPVNPADDDLGNPGENIQQRLDEAIEETFPGSDPVSMQIE